MNVGGQISSRPSTILEVTNDLAVCMGSPKTFDHFPFKQDFFDFTSRTIRTFFINFLKSGFFLGEESSISSALGSTETDRNAAAAEAGQLVGEEGEEEEGRTSWLETDIDTSRTRDRAEDTVGRNDNKVIQYNFLVS